MIHLEGEGARGKIFVRFNLIGFTFSESRRHGRGVFSGVSETWDGGESSHVECLKKKPSLQCVCKRGLLHVCAPLYLLISLCGQRFAFRHFE